MFNSETPTPPTGPDIDPGIFLVDSFMSEEDEQRILDEIDEEIQRQQVRSLSAAVTYLSNTRLEGTAALNRLLKGTVRSSTALVSNSLLEVMDRFRQVAGTCSLARPLKPAPLGTTSGTIAKPECPPAATIITSTVQ